MKAVIKAQDMKDLVEKTKRFVSKNNNNEMMRFIHIVVDAEKQEVRAEAVDGHRFSVAYGKLVEADESFECFITPEIPKITRYDEYVEIETDGDKAFVTVGDSIRGYRQLKKPFFDILQMVETTEDKEPAIKVAFNSKLLAEALQSVKDASDKYNTARLYLYNSKAPVLIRSNEKDVAGVLPINITAEKWERDAEMMKGEKVYE